MSDSNLYEVVDKEHAKSVEAARVPATAAQFMDALERMAPEGTRVGALAHVGSYQVLTAPPERGANGVVGQFTWSPAATL